MRREMDIIRHILKSLEENTEMLVPREKINLGNYTVEQIHYHLDLMVNSSECFRLL